MALAGVFAAGACERCRQTREPFQALAGEVVVSVGQPGPGDSVKGVEDEFGQHSLVLGEVQTRLVRQAGDVAGGFLQGGGVLVLWQLLEFGVAQREAAQVEQDQLRVGVGLDL